MIGQVDLVKKLKKTQARSVLLTGPAHWGKKTLLRECFQKEESVYEITGNAATFRDSIDRIYQTVRPTVYLIPDLDKANATVQNVLLKVLEEPPQSARFFLTASGTVLPTIISRCVVYRMVPYTNDELGQFEVPEHLSGMFRSPGELKLLDFPESQELIEMLKNIEYLLRTATLASVLKAVKNFNWRFHELGVSQDIFVLLIRNLFGESAALDWVRAQPDDAVRYIRCHFFMKLWLELQEG